MLTCEELLLIHYLLEKDEIETPVKVRAEFCKELDRLTGVVRLSTKEHEELSAAADLTMLIIKTRPFPTKNALVGVIAGCTLLVMHGYVMHVDWNEIDQVVTMLESGTWTRAKLLEWLERKAA